MALGQLAKLSRSVQETWGDAVWLRYRIGNPMLATLPLYAQYALAEYWGRRRVRTVRCSAARDSLASACVQLEVMPPDKLAERYCGLMSRIALDEHRMAVAPIARVLTQIDLSGAGAVQEIIQNGCGGLVLSAHFGRMGMCAAAVRALGGQGSVLTAALGDVGQQSAVLRWVMRRNNLSMQRFAQGRSITADESALRLRAVLRQKKILMAAIDGMSTQSQARANFRFGPGHVAIPTGLPRLAEAMACPVVFVLMRDTGGAAVQVQSWALPSDAQQAIQTAFDLLYEAVRAEPWQWMLLPHLPNVWQPAPLGGSGAWALRREGLSRLAQDGCSVCPASVPIQRQR